VGAGWEGVRGGLMGHSLMYHTNRHKWYLCCRSCSCPRSLFCSLEGAREASYGQQPRSARCNKN